MSIFSSRRKGTASDPSDGTARAVLTPAILTMVVDGSVDKAELEQLANLCAFSPIFRHLGVDGTFAIIKGVHEDIEARGPNAVMAEAVEGLSPALRETAMIFAMRVAMADGRLEDLEKQILMTMSRHMQISDQVTDTIFSVVLMMQRPATA